MTAEERDATLAICILAAYADGRKGDEERDELKRIVASLPADADLAALHQDVLLGRRTLKDAASRLGPPELRQLAYEMAVCICDADGVHDEAEGRFLAELQRELGLEAGKAEEVERASAALVTAPLAPPAAPSAAAGPPPAAPGAAPAVDQAALDKMILDASILNGALELLPESLSTMAIIPLQMRLVYRVGKAHGYELDRGHVKDLLAAMGVGLTSQYVEQLGRQLVGGVLGALGGGLLRGLGRQAVSTGMAFASTYALGQVAKRYYAGGRKLDAQALRETFQSMLAEARSIGQARAPDIAARAQTLDARQVVELVRGG